MNAGTLDRRIDIQQAMPSKNAAGEKTRAWTPLADDVPAGVQLPSTRQVMNSQQMQSEIDAIFTIRYRTDLTAKEDRRISYEGRIYRIKGVRETGSRREGLLLDCTSRAE